VTAGKTATTSNSPAADNTAPSLELAQTSGAAGELHHEDTMIEHIALAASLIIGLALAIDNRRLRNLIAPFDRDGDGRPGG
jgi:hypothetical protein